MRENLMSGLMGGSWKRSSPVDHRRVPGRCAERPHNGSIGTQSTAPPPPRQLPTRLRTGNAAVKFNRLDWYVEGRLHRLLVKRYGRNLHAGQADAWRRDWFESHGLYRLRGTVKYPGGA